LQVLYNLGTQACSAAKDFEGAANYSKKELALYQDNKLQEANLELGRLEVKLLAARRLDRSDAIVLEMLLNTRVLQSTIYIAAHSIPAALNAASSLQELLKEWVKFFEGHRRVTLSYLSVLVGVYASADHLERAQAVCEEAVEIVNAECNGEKETMDYFVKVLGEIERMKTDAVRTDSRHGTT
jgi:hypothetical protein